MTDDRSDPRTSRRPARPHPALHRRRVRRLASTARPSTCSTRCPTRPTRTAAAGQKARHRPRRRRRAARVHRRPVAADAAARARRGSCNRIADVVEARDARLAELETFDTGLPITQALGQAQRAAENFRFFADLIVAQADDAFKVPGAPAQLRQPQADRRRRADHAVEHPVHARVLEARARRWPPATRWCSSRPSSRRCRRRLWAEIFEEAGLPDGVFNLVNGLGEEAGDALVKHPDVPLISFTGESRTGQTHLRATPRRTSRACRWSSAASRPRVVFADADLDAAIDSDPVRRLLAQRRALHRGQPDPRRARRSTTSSSSSYAARAEQHRGRRPARPEDRGRRAGAPRALRQGA